MKSIYSILMTRTEKIIVWILGMIVGSLILMGWMLALIALLEAI